MNIDRLSLLAGAGLALALSACAFQSADHGDSELGRRKEALELDSRDALLAALGSLTLDCLGTANPTSYVIDRRGSFVRNFATCGGTDAAKTLRGIDAILGVAGSREGQADGLAQYYADTWRKFQNEFPPDIV